ncbi:hypothetical protein IWW48_003482 [Coemansia sp. RSA 1200]|nr:hypothetical protein IWW48_003482 [Coemansia sp. RSA 1200]
MSSNSNSTPRPDDDGDGSSLVGRWFSVDGNQGVVRYVGPVAGTSGTWLGVEWADAGRGKHGGTRDGHRYFRCLLSPSAKEGGSFIRKVERIDWGQTLLEAARGRYIVDDYAAQVDAILPHAIDGRRRGRIEAVGFDKIARQQADIQTLETLGLDSLRVYGVGHSGRSDREETSRLLGTNTRTLLLANNYLTQWSAVTGILAALRSVETLDISANHFATPLVLPECEKASQAGVASLDTLRLDSSPGLTWQDASAAAAQLSVRSMSFGWSGVSALASTPIPAPGIQGLEELRLEYNRITDITALSSQLPRLRILSLRGNRALKDILPNDSSELLVFPALESLNLAATGIAHWTAVDRLSRLPKLTTLCLAQTPLFETAISSAGGAKNADAPRAQTIGRLGRITKLDGSAVPADERAELERHYLALCARQLPASHASPPSNGNSATLLARLAQLFPRIPELVSKHGAPHIEAQGGRSGLKHRLAAVTMEIARGPDVRSAAVVRSVAKQIIRSMLVRQLHPIAMRLARTRSGFAVYLCADPSGDKDAWVLLDPETTRDLAFYGLEDRGSVIRILLPA